MDRDAAPSLRPWSRIWRYLITIVASLLFLTLVFADYAGEFSDVPTTRPLPGGLIFLDLLLGIIALCLMPLRRRYPLVIAVVTAAFSSVSASSLASAIWAALSLSTRRRLPGVVLVGIVWLLATVVYEMVVRPGSTGSEIYPSAWASGGLAVAIYAICVATGFYIGARRALLVTLRERAENAEHEQAQKAESARYEERTRIAREMHDVLAHRISLVALHAGALSYRTDLSREEITQAAGIIQDNAHFALTELREVLGVLRGGQIEVDPGVVEPAQPTLADLPILLAEAREAGMAVSLAPTKIAGGSQSPAVAGLSNLSQTVSRTAYRIVQEGLTNARKHSTGLSVSLRLARSGDLLVVELRNPLSDVRADDGEQRSPATGVGLIGLRERVDLAGGRIEYGTNGDDAFFLKAWLPWI